MTTEERLQAALALLRELEFGTYLMTSTREGHCCPRCRNFRREGHKPDCTLARDLAPIITP